MRVPGRGVHHEIGWFCLPHAVLFRDTAFEVSENTAREPDPLVFGDSGVAAEALSISATEMIPE